MKKVIALLIGIGVLSVSIYATQADATKLEVREAQAVCPDSGGWTKVDNLSGHEYTYTVPDKSQVVEWCWKAGTTVEYGTEGTPSTDKITVKSDVKSELSHASFKLDEIKGEPKPRLTFLCKAPETGKADAYISGSEGFTSVEVEAGDYLFRVLNQGNVDITSYEIKLASNLIYSGGEVKAGGYDFFTIDEAKAGLKIHAQPSGQHGTASTNETLCEMSEDESEPTPEPEPEQETHHNESSSSSTSEAKAPSCPETAPVKLPANLHVYRKGDQAIVKWFPTDGKDAHIYYKENSSSDWQYSLRDVANTGYYLINGLGNMDITFAVQQANGCAAGPISRAIVDGPTSDWVLFR